MSSLIQLKVNLPEELQSLLQAKASKFGVPLTQYVKHIIMKDLEDQKYLIFKASDETDKAARSAMKNLDKAVDAKDFFGKLHNEG